MTMTETSRTVDLELVQEKSPGSPIVVVTVMMMTWIILVSIIIIVGIEMVVVVRVEEVEVVEVLRGMEVGMIMEKKRRMKWNKSP